MFSGVLCGRRLFLKLLYGDFYFVVVQNYTRAHVDQNSCAVLLSGRGRLSNPEKPFLQLADAETRLSTNFSLTSVFYILTSLLHSHSVKCSHTPDAHIRSFLPPGQRG